MDYRRENQVILERLSLFLNANPNLLTRELVDETVKDVGCTQEEAVGILLFGVLDLYSNSAMRNLYLPYMIAKAPLEEYLQNPYRKLLLGKTGTYGSWQVVEEHLEPFELCVLGEAMEMPDGRYIPRLGYVEERYAFPAILEHSREWMTLLPNELETMKDPIQKAHGNVLVLGLGLGYAPSMMAQKDSVSRVVIVERDPAPIAFYKEQILPHLDHRDKIYIVNADALEYISHANEFDFVFADLWHDPSDGVSMYKQLKTKEVPGVEYAYWIEKTLQWYDKNRRTLDAL